MDKAKKKHALHDSAPSSSYATDSAKDIPDSAKDRAGSGDTIEAQEDFDRRF